MADSNVAPIIVMGVQGSGKSTIGALLASALAVPFIDGDDLHTPQAKAKMASGHPLNDDDRAPWLAAIAHTIAEHQHHGSAGLGPAESRPGEHAHQPRGEQLDGGVG